MQCFHFQKQKTNWLWHSGTISHDASNEPEAYLEPSQTSKVWFANTQDRMAKFTTKYKFSKMVTKASFAIIGIKDGIYFV